MKQNTFGKVSYGARKTLSRLTCVAIFSASVMAQSSAETPPAGDQSGPDNDRVAFVGGTVVSPHLASPILDAVVLIRNGKIEAVGPASLTFDDDYQVIDVAGRFLAPGYIDAHMHFFQSGSAFTRPDSFDYSQIQPYKDDRTWVEQHLEDTSVRYLMSGVTSVVDMCGPSLNYEVRENANKSLFAPTVATAGACISSFAAPVLDLGDDDPVFQRATSPEDAITYVREQLKREPDLIKIIWSPDNGETPQQLFDLFEHAIRLARSEGVRVAVHATDLENAKMAIRAGANVLVHGVMTGPIDDEFIALVKQYHITYVPTLAVHQKMADIARNDLSFSGHEHELIHPDVLESFRKAASMPEKAGMMVQMLNKYMPYIDAEEAAIAELSPQEQAIVAQLKGLFAEEITHVQRDNLKRLYDEGVTLALGTDAGNPGVLHGGSLLTEMAEWQKAGLPLHAIFKAATINGAKVMERETSLGSIEVGKWADLVVLSKNPLDALQNLGAIEGVMKHGRYHTVDQLQYRIQMLP
ncbi:amidohydrolase family protein [Kordiimonas sp.]|uniref:amidohydrolase family protein n=1 Tax=Kordiimonas sp. TaxID=1970157 RepID=UPI003A8F371C